MLTVRPRYSNMMNDTPAMPLKDAHSGGFFVSSNWLAESSRREAVMNAREGIKA